MLGEGPHSQYPGCLSAVDNEVAVENPQMLPDLLRYVLRVPGVTKYELGAIVEHQRIFFGLLKEFQGILSWIP